MEDGEMFIEGGWYSPEEIKRASLEAGVSEEIVRRVIAAIGSLRDPTKN
jgi:hypothetical protein